MEVIIWLLHWNTESALLPLLVCVAGGALQSAPCDAGCDGSTVSPVKLRSVRVTATLVPANETGAAGAPSKVSVNVRVSGLKNAEMASRPPMITEEPITLTMIILLLT